jgi:tetratricopeptide (TPR) repeat protein
MDVSRFKGLLKETLAIVKRYPELFAALKKGDKEAFTHEFKQKSVELTGTMNIEGIVEVSDPEHPGKTFASRGMLGWIRRGVLAGIVYTMLSSPTAVMAACNKDEAERYSSMGRQSLSTQQFSQALDSYSKARDLCPNESGYYNGMALAMTKLEKFDEALKHFRKAIDLMPTNQSAYNNLGTYYEALSKSKNDPSHLPKAIEAYTRAAELNNSSIITKSALRRIEKIKQQL